MSTGIGSAAAKPVSVFGFSLHMFSTNAQFLICCVFVFIFFLAYGYLQELIFTLDAFKSHGWYLTCVQFAFYAIFGCLERLFAARSLERRIPLRTYVTLSLLTVGTMGLSNASLNYLNYPTEVIFKCCKLIPVLIGGILIQGKNYTTVDFVAAFCMCVGLIFFTIAESNVSPNFHPTGIAMILCALLCDAIIGNVQEKNMKKYRASNAEVLFYSYSMGFVLILVYLLLNGQFQTGFISCSKRMLESYGYAFAFSLCGYLGVQIILTVIRHYGAFNAVVITTCRKAISIVISFVIFSKPFTFQYVWSGLIVSIGIYLNIFSKHQSVSTFKDFGNFMKICIVKILFRKIPNVYEEQYYRNV